MPNKRVLTRSVKHLYPLEVTAEDNNTECEKSNQVVDKPVVVSPDSATPPVNRNQRPVRDSAVAARCRLQQLAESDSE